MHLVSEAAALTSVPPLLPQVSVPEAIGTLLRERVARVGDRARMAELFVDPPLVLHALYPIWLRGPEALATANFMPRGVRLLPSSFSSRGDAGFVSGTWVVGEGPDAMPITNFFMYVEKGPDGAWKIAAEGITAKAPPRPRPVRGEALVAELDEAGIRHGVVLSLGYQRGGTDDQEAPDEYAAIRRENDWVAAEAARFPGRLTAFCGIDPLRSYALEELRRCARLAGVRGIKLHFGSSGVDLRNPRHLLTIQQLFAEANRQRLAIVVHLMSDDYGPALTQLFLERVLPSAPDIPVQIAHLAGAGPGLDADEALQVFARAAEAGDRRMRNVYFDVGSTVTLTSSRRERDLVAQRLRQLGLQRILFASDRGAQNDPPDRAWSAFRQLPLSDEEFAAIASNVAPYIR
jgi:predicted TIM-barrel fold metal-dependent hydrolase